MEKPLTKSFHLNIKYKPSIRINVSSTLNVVEGETANICCVAWSNPKPTFISLQMGDKELVSAFNNSSLCYKMSNVSRHDTGNYVCRSKNEIGEAFSETSLIISYPPVINIRYRNLTEYSSNREIRCLAQGEPNSYNYFNWEHQSMFNEHIRYLGETDDGILRLPEMNISNIYQDTGFYICNVSNGIPDYGGNVFQQDRGYYLVSIGPPVFAAANKRIQDNNIEASVAIKVKVYSTSAIICHNIEEVGNMSVKLQYLEVRTKYILLKESLHDAIVTVNGLEIIFVLNGLNLHGSRKFNVTVCNSYGESSFDVIWKPFVNYSSEQNTLSLEGTIITIIAFLIIIVVLVAGMGIYVRYLKQMYRKRIIVATNIPSTELIGDESSHYADIIEDDNILTPSQEADRIVAENSNRTALSDEHSSTSSNTDINASENLDDGYEKPYSTLVVNNRGEDEHVYHKTKQYWTYENSTLFENSTIGHSIEVTEQGFSLDNPKTNIYANEGQESANMNYGENYSKETDDDCQQPNVYKQNETQEYINLSLKQ